MNDKPSEYGKYFIKIKCNSDDDLPLNKTLTFQMLTITVFAKDGKYYAQISQTNVCMSYKNDTI